MLRCAVDEKPPINCYLRPSSRVVGLYYCTSAFSRRRRHEQLSYYSARTLNYCSQPLLKAFYQNYCRKTDSMSKFLLREAVLASEFDTQAGSLVASRSGVVYNFGYVSVCMSDDNFRKHWCRKFIFAHPVRLKFAYEGHPVKVKVTGAQKVEIPIPAM